MDRSTRWWRILPVLVLTAGGTLALAFSSGPPLHVTGAPGEGTCADPSCHTSFAVNSGPGTLAVNAPALYAPGDTLDLSVALSQPGQRRWGFQLTMIDTLGDPVGQILVTDNLRTQVDVGAGARQYLMHTQTGTDNGTFDAAPGWSFRWAAPDTAAGTVTVWAAGNAANGGGNQLGDYIYTTSTPIAPLASGVGDEGAVVPRTAYVGQPYPNPFNAGVRIPFTLDAGAAGRVRLDIVNIAGRVVRVLIAGRLYGPGDYAVRWDGTNDDGAKAPSGVYLVRLRSRSVVDTRRVTLLR